MKDRIKKIMDAQHMTQQVFADFIGTTPATLSGIFNGRTRPTINIVEAIKKKIPDINTDWLLFGHGDMYLNQTGSSADVESSSSGGQIIEPSIFDFPSSASPASPTANNARPTATSFGSVRNTRLDFPAEGLKNFDKPTRHVTEIRVYYDDQTWESFLPSKK